MVLGNSDLAFALGLLNASRASGSVEKTHSRREVNHEPGSDLENVHHVEQADATGTVHCQTVRMGRA